MKKFLSLLLTLTLLLPCVSMINVTAESETGIIKSAVLNLGSTLSLDYYAEFNVPSEDVTMRFTSSSGKTTTVQGTYSEEKKMYKFTYTGITPQCMTDNIKAELIYNDTVLDVEEEYSVKDYCDNQLTENADKLGFTAVQFKAFKKLLADMLIYGEEAQLYRGYNTDNLAADSDWVTAYKSSFSAPTGVKKIESNDDEQNKVISVGLTMANVNRIYFRLELEDYNDVTIKINDSVVDKSTLEKNADGTYKCYSEDIKATEFDKVYKLELIKDSATISSVSYNMYAYIENMYNKEAVAGIVKALYNYGVSAKAYVKAINEPDTDFELDDEDILETVDNLVDSANSNFDTVTTVNETDWEPLDNNAVLSISQDGYKGGNCLKFTRLNSQVNYSSAMLDIYPYVNSSALYEISMMVKVSGNGGDSTLSGVIRTNSATSFSGTSNYKGFTPLEGLKNDTWYEYKFELFVETSDIGQGKEWRIGFHNLQSQITEVYIDNLVIIQKDFYDYARPVTSAQTWVANELVLVSDRWYSDPYNQVELNLTLTNGIDTYTVPGFWDGGKVWRVRFVCPTEGTWTYTTSMGDPTNEGLHGVTNTFECTEYSGELDIYKHGFVKTVSGTKYFMYDDGTPFFYLGDTHWSLGGETMEMVQTIVDKRVEQGYTVYQSEPLGVSFDLTDGVTSSDIEGLKDFDEKFKYIASKGLVHANAEFFFPSEMNKFISNNGGYSDTVLGTVDGIQLRDLSEDAKAALEKLSRYWVARYSAYPVMWTLAQEVDNDYFWKEHDTHYGHTEWGEINNPYKYVATYIGEHDPYNSPLSGHMENADQTKASSSAIDDISAHTWYAAQWKSLYNGNETAKIAQIAQDFWASDKVAINYEGMYWYLATKDFGARAQGWGAYLSGMYGHGWGGQDTWCYLYDYNEDSTNYYGTLDVITPAEKKAKTWQDALNSNSAAQMGIMKDFFENTVEDWWNLIPRFEDTAYLQRSSGAYGIIASKDDKSEIVVYFYNFSDGNVAQNPNSLWAGDATGTLKNLSAETDYNYMWFNPITGEKTYGEFTSTAQGTWEIPKKATQDMVLYVYTE